jgi:hypothetical protein
MADTDATEELRKQADDELNTIVVEPDPVEPDDDDDDDDDAEPSPAPKENAKARQRQRRLNFNELKENQSRLEQALQQEREARARMEGLMQANLRPPQQQQGPHPLEQAVEDVLREQDEFYHSYSAALPKMTEAQKEQAAARARALEIKKGTAMARLANAQMGVGPQPHPQQQQQQAFQMQVDSRYPDLAGSSEQVRRWGWARVQQLQLENRHTNIWDLMDEAADETRKKFGIGSTKSAPKPTPQTQAKFVGASKGAGGGGTAESKAFKITKKQAELARNAYPTLPEKQAYQKWWNEVGKKYA